MRVSVVMATRNPELKALREAMDSVYGQTYKDIELIIVDDGSDQPVIEVIKPLINESVPTRVFRIEPSGLGAALNHGIAQAEGKYIARIDDDDIMLPTRLERQVEFIDEQPDVCCVGTWFYDRVENKYYPHRQYPTVHENIIKSLLSLKWGMAHTTVMYRKSAFEEIGGYRILGGGQDLDLFLQMGTVGKLANLNDYLTCYTVSANGLGTMNPNKKEAHLFALEDVKRRHLYPEFEHETEKSIVRLKNIIKNGITKVSKKTLFKRYLMIIRIKLLGCSYNSIKNENRIV